MKSLNTFLQTLGVVTLVGMASLTLPFPAQAGGVQVSVGVGLPVVVAPAPVIVQPAPVVVPQPVIVQRAPVIIAPPPVVVSEPQVVYGYPYYRGYYRRGKHHHHHED
jgi:PXPV repeat-containing protein